MSNSNGFKKSLPFMILFIITLVGNLLMFIIGLVMWMSYGSYFPENMIRAFLLNPYYPMREEQIIGVLAFYVGIFLSVIFLVLWLVTMSVSSSSSSAASAYTNQEAREIHCSLIKHFLLYTFTCGIWYYIWIYKSTRYLNRAPGGETKEPVVELLLCMFIPFYSIYWYYKQGKKLDAFLAQRGFASGDMGGVCLFFSIFSSIIACVLMQDKFNQLSTHPLAS